MSTRVIWRRAHPVKLPAKPAAYERIHAELRDYRDERLREQLAYELDDELARDPMGDK